MTDANRRFCKLAGICWHEIEFDPFGKADFPYCKLCNRENISWHWEYPNGHCKRVADDLPDFSDPIEVLRVMKEKLEPKDFAAFMHFISLKISYTSPHLVIEDFIEQFLDAHPGALRDRAIEWMEGKG